jgi:adenosine/AMP kinase
MELELVTIENPNELNLILGQSHFIKTVEDLHETLVQAVPGIKFGIAFCEASGEALIRLSGNDPALLELAKKNALALSAGHIFIIFLGGGFFPINVLNHIKLVPEVCRIFCATANPVQVIVAESEQGRGVLGVIDGFKSKGVEDESGVEWRKGLLRKIGYKLG